MLTLVFTLLIPELVGSVKGLYLLVETRLPQWISYLESLNPEAEWLEEIIAGINLEKSCRTLAVGQICFLRDW